MTYETDFYDYLANHADATAFRAAIGGTRIYWGRMPQSPTFPLVVIDTIDALPGYTLNGDNGLQETTLQITIAAATPSACVTIREALRSLLHGVSQVSNGSTLFHSVTIRNFTETYIDDEPGGFFNLPVDVQFIHGDN